jgi:hypothetical protein
MTIGDDLATKKKKKKIKSLMGVQNNPQMAQDGNPFFFFLSF